MELSHILHVVSLLACLAIPLVILDTALGMIYGRCMVPGMRCDRCRWGCPQDCWVQRWGR